MRGLHEALVLAQPPGGALRPRLRVVQEPERQALHRQALAPHAELDGVHRVSQRDRGTGEGLSGSLHPDVGEAQQTLLAQTQGDVEQFVLDGHMPRQGARGRAGHDQRSEALLLPRLLRHLRPVLRVRVVRLSPLLACGQSLPDLPQVFQDPLLEAIGHHVLRVDAMPSRESAQSILLGQVENLGVDLCIPGHGAADRLSQESIEGEHPAVTVRPPTPSPDKDSAVPRREGEGAVRSCLGVIAQSEGERVRVHRAIPVVRRARLVALRGLGVHSVHLRCLDAQCVCDVLDANAVLAQAHDLMCAQA